MSFDWDYYYCPRCSKKYRSTECEDRLDWWILFFRTLNDIIDRCASHRADYPSKVLNELSLFHSSLYHSHSQQYVQSTSTTTTPQSRSTVSGNSEVYTGTLQAMWQMNGRHLSSLPRPSIVHPILRHLVTTVDDNEWINALMFLLRSHSGRNYPAISLHSPR